MIAVFDIETNGLLFEADRVHCLSIYESETDAIETFNDEKDNRYSITEGLSRLNTADYIVGHNIINYDLPVIKRIYPFFSTDAVIVDTLLCSRLYHPNLLDIDKKHQWRHMPLQMYGRHSLKAYGYRLGEFKGEFGETSDWKQWSQEMQDYCEQDVVVTKKLCDHFHPYLSGSKWSTR
jgi:hypothetical protein